MACLHFGANSCVEVDFADGVTSGEYGTPRGDPLADPAAAMAAALREPIDYPVLARSTTPGDHVVLPVDPDIPQTAQIVAATINALVEAGVDPDGIAILLSPRDDSTAESDPCRMIAPALRRRIAVATHDPTDRRQLAYLAASEAGDPILVNRALHEADLVLPLGCLRCDEAAGYFGIHGCVFPAFSDIQTQQHFRGLGALNAGGSHKRALVEEVDHVAWLLGINFTIQLVPAAGDRVLHVLAGQSDSIRQRGRQLYREAWASTASHRAALVIASIEGGPSQQTWENLGRAVQTAQNLVDEGGAIAVCCELSAYPGPAVQRMLAAESREAALRQVGKERPIDALPAAQLVRALQRDKVYLLSRLDASLVEDLDIVPLADPEELTRLARRYRSCILLSNAAYASVSVAETNIAKLRL